MTLKPTLVKGEPVKVPANPKGRGRVAFPEFFTLEISKDHTKGDCLIYPDSPDNWKVIGRAKCRYNHIEKKKTRGKVFTIRREVRHGDPVIVVQRIF